MKKITEWCSHCGNEVEIDAIKYVKQKCPICGKTIKACCLCDMDEVDCTKCAKMARKEKNQ